MKEPKLKVIIFQMSIPSYRVPIFNKLAEYYDLTVVGSDDVVSPEKCKFKIEIEPYKAISKFIFHKSNLQRKAENYDVAIYLGNITILKYALLPFKLHRRYKTIVWTIGVSASRTKKYDANKRWDFVRDFFYKKADACVFYSDYPIAKYIKRGFKQETLFVANNTVEVVDSDVKLVKDSILFIGSLYRQKGIFDLLESYSDALEKKSNIPQLNIIGGGEDFENVKSWISERALGEKIRLLGPVYDNIEKEKYFKKAFATISPRQAGLGVLESMGYGTPFITSSDAITGGERFNIKDGETGILYERKSDLKDIIIDISENPGKYIEMGENAAKYYKRHSNPETMIRGFVDAINYVIRK